MAIQSVSPFELSCEFLMDDEKQIIQDFVNNMPNSDGIQKVKEKFREVCGIEF